MTSIFIQFDDRSLLYNDKRKNLPPDELQHFSVKFHINTYKTNFDIFWNITNVHYDELYFGIWCKDYDLAYNKIIQIVEQQINFGKCKIILFGDIIDSDEIFIYTNKEREFFKKFLLISDMYPSVTTHLMNTNEYK
jgi:hypothetical protein